MYVTLSCRASCWPSSCVTCNRHQSLGSRVLQAGLYQQTLHVLVKDPVLSESNGYLGTAQFAPCPHGTTGKQSFFKVSFCNRQRLTLQEIPLTPDAFSSLQFCIKMKFSFKCRHGFFAPPQSKCFSHHLLNC